MKMDMPEDTLQTFRLCHKSGIKVLMLSGDFEERCMSAAYSSGVIPDGARIARLGSRAEKNDLVKLVKRHITFEWPNAPGEKRVESASISGGSSPPKELP
jgi:magnesium-transporting ATPase (P-type)